MKTFLRWFPAMFIMAAIFLLSAQPSSELPNFFGWDYILKKSGHIIGYGLLASSYFYALRHQGNKTFGVAWLFAILYALTDEYHQSFIAGRHSSIWDVIIFDNLGALISLYLFYRRTQVKNLSK